MLKLLTVLEDVMTRYIPWHSEAELRKALDTIAELRNEISGIQTPAETTAAEPVNPTNVGSADTVTTPAVSTVAPVADSTTPVPSVIESTMPVANATDANATVNTAAIDAPHIQEPEMTPYPGSYTPPPVS